MTEKTKRWQFWIDVGGTFTDVIARSPQGTTRRHKTLSSGVVKGCLERDGGSNILLDSRRHEDPAGCWAGYQIRFVIGGDVVVGEVLSHHGSQLNLDTRIPSDATTYELFSDESAPLVAIRYLLGVSRHAKLPALDIRLGTTRGTNALLTRTGSKTALVTNRGFEDLWRIGYQTRPDLFALDIHKPHELFSEVVGVSGRVLPDGEEQIACIPAEIEKKLAGLLENDVTSLAICLLHANVNPAHEQRIAEIAHQLPFVNVSVSHEVSSLRKAIPRGDTTILDAYLTPILQDYVAEVIRQLHPDSSLTLMTSAGGLTSASDFRGKDSILSGPAGGVVGVAAAAKATGYGSAIGFDMGGTSTDVSRWAGDFELEFETEKAGVRVVTPMMAIETVAAGGGSLCRFDDIKLTVGPKSAGASPGPACYGGGGPLAVTDINLILGRIMPSAFPFELDRASVEDRLDEIAVQLEKATGQAYSRVQLANGFLQVANTNMVEAIRCVTVDRGIDPRSDVLVAFGGAAGQHACAVATELGIQEILVPLDAGILSAKGIGQAEVSVHHEHGIYRSLATCEAEGWEDIFGPLRNSAVEELRSGKSEEEICIEDALDLRFVGLDGCITVSRPHDNDFRIAYEHAFKEGAGYVPKDSEIEVVTARVSATFKATPPKASRRRATRTQITSAETTTIYWEAQHHEASIFARSRLREGHVVQGPALITEPISTTVVDPGWEAEVLTGGEILLTRHSEDSHHVLPSRMLEQADPVLLEVFNKRFETIATQMGVTLRRTSRSVNVKERLDYSCAIFTAQGDLVVNAPHIPVHLGAMGSTVKHVIAWEKLALGDVIVTNDPYQGGSHLPDVTVVSPVHDANSGELLFLTASRAHHAEIGGIRPGSMPPGSKNLSEEGVLIEPLKVVEAGVPHFGRLEQVLQSSPFPSRNPEMNLADVAAQVAANRQGALGLLRFVDDYTWPHVEAYMQFIQDAAERKMRSAFRALPDATRIFVDHLDDGSPISLKMTIQGDEATLDFHGTGSVLPGNLNANPAIVTAGVMYCLRCLLREDIPLNQGVLAPITIILPECLLNPSGDGAAGDRPAMVGGNVETSQRVVDTILGALGIAAASQGTMNNFLFGNEHFGYYETICGGAGATPESPGADAVHTHMTNTRLTDPEVLERRFPVRLRSFSIRRGSGGRGHHRGGDGIIREIEFLDTLDVSILSQRRGAFAPYGVAGGEPGLIGRNLLLRHGQEILLDGSASLRVQIGDVIRIETPGGGGWGTE